MSEAENKDLVDRAFATNPFLGAMDAAELREFYAEGFVNHVPSTMVGVRDAFSGIEIELHGMIAEGDRVVVQWSASGTHTGEFLGVPPSGEIANVTGITVLRCADRRIVEGWANINWV